VNISLESPLQPEVQQLVEELDAYQIPLYPAESHHGVEICLLTRPNVLFAVARDEAGHAVACGAVVIANGYGELKRFYTTPFLRGKGVARALLVFLEDESKARGCQDFMLETGYLQADAIALYGRCGYERCGPFGEYTDDPNSVFMKKSILQST
jgi:putative acetyltransferase